MIRLFQPYTQYRHVHAVVQDHVNTSTLKYVRQGVVQIDQRE